jgi:transketolase
MPCWELFRDQSEEYRESVIPSDVKHRIAIEAASSFGWSEWVGDNGMVIGVDHFGASAEYQDIFENLGFTGDQVANKAVKYLKK